MTPERIARLHTVLSKRQPDLTVITDNVHKGRNLSAIVRTADAVGIGHIHCVINDQDYRSFRGTAKGSHQWVEVHREPNIEDAIKKLKANGLQIIAADVAHNSCDFKQIDYTQPTALLLGAEKLGLSDTARAHVDQFVTIAMMGMVESYNVSVAAGIILNEALYQRQAAGFYNTVRLSKAEYQYQFFAWACPKIKAFCDVRQIEYPIIDDQGEIINAVEWYADIKTADTQHKEHITK